MAPISQYPEDASPEYYDRLFRDRIDRIGGAASAGSGKNSASAGRGGLGVLVAVAVFIALKVAVFAPRSSTPRYEYRPPQMPQITIPRIEEPALEWPVEPGPWAPEPAADPLLDEEWRQQELDRILEKALEDARVRQGKAPGQ